MERVTGIGGIYFTAKDPELLEEWYRKHLGLDVQDWLGTTFQWHQPGNREVNGTTTWSLHREGGEMFRNNSAPFVINYRVEDLRGLLALLREEGCEVDDSDYGIFGWVEDPEGNRVELWQPPAGPLPT